MTYTFSPLSDDAVVMQFGADIHLSTHQKIQNVATYLQKHPFTGMREYVPAYTTLTIYYNPVIVYRSLFEFDKKKASPYQLVTDWLTEMMENISESEGSKPRTIHIPVCYSEAYGPDLQTVAAHNELSTEEVVQLHTANEYLVYMMGFAPGFPYIGGMNESIATPRKESPRLQIPAGSVGIAGSQTGMYPIETPGGWQLIGQTPLQLFRPDKEPPALLQPGDRIRFYAISSTDFKQWKDD